MTPRWLKMKPACEYSAMSEKTLMRHIVAGEIYATKRRGGVWIVDRESIDEFYLSERKNENQKFVDFTRRAGLRCIS
jgi:predicted site-specific integrase-resolvase